ncbi:hypothetical protein CR513_59380, partial [Mucuna pruriens]
MVYLHEIVEVTSENETSFAFSMTVLAAPLVAIIEQHNYALWSIVVHDIPSAAPINENDHDNSSIIVHQDYLHDPSIEFLEMHYGKGSLEEVQPSTLGAPSSSCVPMVKIGQTTLLSIWVLLETYR